MSKPEAKSKRGRPKSMDPEQVTDIAMKAYWQGCIEDVSVNEICKIANISKPSLYREFGNEDGLMYAALDHYAQKVLTKPFAILSDEMGVRDTLAALADFTCNDPSMRTGCLFYKMRAAKLRLGEQTRAGIDELDALAQEGFEKFFKARHDTGDWGGAISVKLAARYLINQIGFALTLRACGENPKDIHDMLMLALSAVQSPNHELGVD